MKRKIITDSTFEKIESGKVDFITIDRSLKKWRNIQIEQVIKIRSFYGEKEKIVKIKKIELKTTCIKVTLEHEDAKTRPTRKYKKRNLQGKKKNNGLRRL